MKSHQTRRTRRINRHDRTAQIQEVGEASGHNRVVGGRHIALTVDEIGKVAPFCADEDADPFLLKNRRPYPRILQRMPHLLQQQPLPRIHHLSLTRSNLKEQRIKPTHRLQPTTHRTRSRTPPRHTLRRHIPQSQPTLTHQRPQTIHTHTRRKHTRHPRQHHGRPFRDRGAATSVLRPTSGIGLIVLARNRQISHNWSLRRWRVIARRAHDHRQTRLVSTATAAPGQPAPSLLRSGEFWRHS